MRTSIVAAFALAVCAVPFAQGCSQEVADDDAGEDAITSNEAGFVDFDFDGEVIAAKETDAAKAISSQLFYTIGDLTAFNANSRVGQHETTNVKTSDAGGGLVKVTFHAKLPVAWPKGKTIPRKYQVTVPKHVDSEGLSAFVDKYDGPCGKDEYGKATFWHDFQPKAPGCTLAPADVTSVSAKVSRRKDVTTGKYPEYKEVWKDDALKVVAIFGYAEGGGASDIGQRQYEEFVTGVAATLPGAKRTEKKSASIAKDVTLEGKVTGPAGQARTVVVTSLLIDTLYTAGRDFDDRYDAISEGADLVVYNGHSELSKNTNALARKGKVAKEKYQLFFFDSCDTFAYLDTALVDRRKEVNGASDPKGSKYLDVVTNVLPSYFMNYAGSSLTFYKALLDDKSPKTYNQILEGLPSDQVVVVSGEEDNAFRP
ncbi:MAG: hypothetical protein JNL38_22070 [Myxococcales bacterium]|jgi:hypothetical protein|nr:hypothetical protein [Myxococcales bacterium]